jgi:hypothetical protein
MTKNIIQSQYSEMNGFRSYSAPIPYNGSLPSWGDGTEIFTKIIVPTNPNNIIRVRISGNWSADRAAVMTFALFHKPIIFPIHLISNVKLGFCPSSWTQQLLNFECQEIANAIDPVEYNFVMGSTAGVNYYLNGDPAIITANTPLSALLKWSIVLEELEA